MTIEQTVEVPESREVNFRVFLPETMPSGKTKVILIFPVKENSPLEEYYNSLPDDDGDIETAIAEGKRKQKDRFVNGADSLQQFCGCLKDIFPEDGVIYQRRWHEEWDREWDK
jgi:hypothetical protein